MVPIQLNTLIPVGTPISSDMIEK
jgi:hypothetical protein